MSEEATIILAKTIGCRYASNEKEWRACYRLRATDNQERCICRDAARAVVALASRAAIEQCAAYVESCEHSLGGVVLGMAASIRGMKP